MILRHSSNNDYLDVVKELNRVDWEFPGAKTPKYSVHKLHWFPGNFVPQIPLYLTEILTKKGQVVFDPFCGSGTTIIEAAKRDRITVGSDINRSGVLITSAKSQILWNSEAKRALCSLLEVLTWDYSSSYIGVNNEYTDNRARVNGWFHADTTEQLAVIWGFINKHSDPGIKNILEMLFSDTLFSCASTQGERTKTGGLRRHHWGWVADNVKPKQPVFHNAFVIFRDNLHKALQVIHESTEDLKLEPLVIQQSADSLAVKDSFVDAIITSPPYIGMIDYTRANRLQYLWNGWELDSERESEIGARFKRRRKNFANEYLSSMKQCIAEASRVLKPGGYFGMVLGASRAYEGVDRKVLELLSSELDMIWGPVSREPQRRRVSDRQGRVFEEFVCVFRKSM